MSTSRVPQKRPKKPPACDACKARRVLCHPQSNGAPCPRCAEKNIVCTTTPVRQGRPRQSVEPEKSAIFPPPETTQGLGISQQLVQPSCSSVKLLPQIYLNLPECPDLTPELVAHFFDCFDLLPEVMHPIIIATSIKIAAQAVSFQLSLLPPQSRVLAMCVIACSSLISFHEAVLGPGLRPESFYDPTFFSSQADVRSCGIQRAAACRAFHTAALKAAWDAGIMLQVSMENAASCFLLDLLEQSDFSGLSRPWASAYISHLRALGPMWRSSSPLYASHWSFSLMSEALLSTRHRKPILITHEDELLLCVSEPPSAEELLTSLQASVNEPGPEILFQAMKPYTFHITRLARQMWKTITGDHVRCNPLSESAVLQLLSSLSLNHTILSHLLARADAALAASAGPPRPWVFLLDRKSGDVVVRGCAYGLITGFTGLVLPLYRELELRADSGESSSHARARMRLLVSQARDLANLAVHELARLIRYVPAVHYALVQRQTLRDYAHFALDEAEAESVVEAERVRDLQTIVGQLDMAAYSQDLFSSPDAASLMERLERYIENATHPLRHFDPDTILADFLFPLDQTWMNPIPPELTI
ncbi:hypothetical protein B0H13DRAFT_661050 [Mycena leptocephala]|nr:hypothetical protein B0H13DRAFT_661050 [Mycena leptocephala]